MAQIQQVGSREDLSRIAKVLWMETYCLEDGEECIRAFDTISMASVSSALGDVEFIGGQQGEWQTGWTVGLREYCLIIQSLTSHKLQVVFFRVVDITLILIALSTWMMGWIHPHKIHRCHYLVGSDQCAGGMGHRNLLKFRKDKCKVQRIELNPIPVQARDYSDRKQLCSKEPENPGGRFFVVHESAVCP